jgi:hypothetical protein
VVRRGLYLRVNPRLELEPLTDSWKGGHRRDTAGTFVIVFLADAVAPLTWQSGFLVDANKSVVVRSV